MEEGLPLWRASVVKVVICISRPVIQPGRRWGVSRWI